MLWSRAGDSRDRPHPTPMNDGSSTPLSSVSPSAVADVMVEVTIASGRVTPNGANIGVAVGQTVQVSAGSDVEDSLHVHGYEKTLTLSPGETSAVSFVADQSGVFEIKTHESGKPVAKLIVS